LDNSEIVPNGIMKHASIDESWHNDRTPGEPKRKKNEGRNDMHNLKTNK
jgi:hypothetical protein